MYKVFGYDCTCVDFSFKFDRFADAVTKFKTLSKSRMNVVFISGVSPKVATKLELSWMD